MTNDYREKARELLARFGLTSNENDKPFDDDVEVLSAELRVIALNAREAERADPANYRPAHWWGDFLHFRTRALHAMNARGRPTSEMVRSLNLQDEAHAERILDATKP